MAGECVLFCDTVTDSIQRLMDISSDRRRRQEEYNEEHGITPTSVQRALQESLHTHEHESGKKLSRTIVGEDEKGYDTLEVISELEEQMREAASKLEFERAAHLRDQIIASLD